MCHPFENGIEAYGYRVDCSSFSVRAFEKNCKPGLVVNQSRLHS